MTEPNVAVAVKHPLPTRKVMSIEYPAIIKNLDKALETLGGDQAVLEVSIKSHRTFVLA